MSEIKHNIEKQIPEITLGRSLSGMIGGIAAIVLSILGLAKIAPTLMLSIATIAIGVSLLFKGAAIAAEYSKLLGHMSGTRTERLELGGGMSVEMLAGAAGIVLGILALLSIETGILEAVAAIVFGSALLLGSGIVTRLNNLKGGVAGLDSHAQRILDDAVASAMSIQMLVGIGACALGILSLVGIASLHLTLIAMLAIGVASILSGSAITTKMSGILRQ